MTLQHVWDDFLTAAWGGTPERVPVAVLADCVYIPGAVGMNTLDYFAYPERWLDANLALVERFPEAVIFPGFWVEYGMANEPSAFGTSVMWRADQAPAMREINVPVEQWGRLLRPDPYSDGFMAWVLRRYWQLEHEDLLPEPYRARIVAARGPFTVAGHVLGPTNFLMALADEPDSTRYVLDALEIMTDTIIRFLQAQLGCLRKPEGILLLDDTVGLLSPSMFNRFAVPYLNRIFDTFEGLLRVYHNDTPCPRLLPHLPALHFELFNFSHLMDIADVRAALGSQIALMGNVGPLEPLMSGTPEQVEAAARQVIRRAGRAGLVLSAGGGTNAGTPPENIDALIRATWA